MLAPQEPSREELLVVIAGQAARIAGQAARITGQDAQITTMAAQVSALVEANEELTGKLARLEHLLSRNSGNSSVPPSKDDQPGRKAGKAKRGRESSGRKKGKQPGAPGSHLAWTDTPDDQVDSFPEGRCECGSDLTGGVDLGVVDRYQQHEIPLVRVAVTQYDQHAVVCACGNVHTAARPEGARGGRIEYGPNLAAFAVYLMVVQFLPAHRVVDLLESLTGAAPSVGFVHGMLERTAVALAEVDARIRTLITLAHVVCADETPLRVGPAKPVPGKTRAGKAKKAKKKAERYLLVACTELYTYYLLGDRDLDTFKAFVLTELTASGAVVVHDRYVVYDNPAFGGLLHQLCCAHLLRDLTDAAETYPDELWPTQIADALRGLIHERNLARAAGATALDPDRAAPLFKAFRDGVKVGLSATTSHGDRPGERKARLLAECFRDREADVLRFTTDLAIPPTSNGAERDLRPSKVQQNNSGRLTSEERTADRYRIRGCISTAAKHGRDALHVLRQAICGDPWMPPDPAPA